MTPVRSGFPVVEDSLDLMAYEARDLLRRVDLVIDHLGTPPDHPLVPLLRALRVRPGEALGMLLATPPARLMDAVRQLRDLATGYRDDLTEPLRRAGGALGWRGAGHDAFLAEWRAQLDHLGGDGAETMPGKLAATADYVESVAGWFSQTRRAMAGALVVAFGSREAVTLKGRHLLEGDSVVLRRAVVTGEVGDAGQLVAAAAAIGASTLSPVKEWYDAGMEHFVAGVDGVPAGGWGPKLAELPYRPATPGGPYGYADGIWVRV